MTLQKEILTYFQSGCKPNSLIGLEVEHFILNHEGTSIPFEGSNGIETIIKQLNTIYNGSLIYEKNYVIGMKAQEFVITIEPGGQLEISILPQINIHKLKEIYDDFLCKLEDLLAPQQMYAISIGYHPLQNNESIPWVPKKRYQIMAEYLYKKGHLAHHMMKSTTSTQVAFDYKDEENFSRKYSLSNRLSVLSSIIFECSPFYEGQLNPNHLSRIQCWLHCDDDRCGFFRQTFNNLYSFIDYGNYIMDIPMIIEKKDTDLSPIGTTTYREYIESHPFSQDSFENQLTMVFPDIRLKNFIEIRTADGLSPDLVMSVPTFWTGLLYDHKNLDEWLRITDSWTYEDMINLREKYIQDGNLDIKLYDKSLHEWILLLLSTSLEGIKRRSHLDNMGYGEDQYLQPLIQIWAKKQTIKQNIQQQYTNTNLRISNYLQQYYKGGNCNEA